MTTDLFADGAGICSRSPEPLDAWRAKYGVAPPDPSLTAHGVVPPWHHPAA